MAYKEIFRNFMAKAADVNNADNLEITAILGFTFKRNLPETAKVIEGDR